MSAREKERRVSGAGMPGASSISIPKIKRMIYYNCYVILMNYGGGKHVGTRKGH